jgi:uncharacterized membrane protein YccC
MGSDDGPPTLNPRLTAVTRDSLVHDPDLRSLRKAGRTALAMSASFLIGIHLVDNPQFAVVATFTAAAVLGIADFSGSRAQRLLVTAATLGAGAVLLAIGTAVSTNTAAASVTMFVVAMAVSFSSVFSGYFAAASSAVIVFYVVATGVEGPTSVIASREAGLAFGGALSLIAAGWLWPSRSTAESRVALSRVYRILAEQVGGLLSTADLSTAHATSRRPADGGVIDSEDDDQLAQAILAAEQAIASSAWRPDGLASPHKARMYMLQGARRIAGLIDVFDRLPIRSVAGLEDVSGHLINELALQLGRCATGVVDYGRVLPEPARIELVKERFTTAGHGRFADDLAAGQESDRLRSFVSWYFVLQQLCWGASLASIHCRAMHNAPLEASVRSEQSTLVRTLADGPSAAKWLRRARRHLSLRSVHFQNSLRLATGLALARLAVGVFGLQHGFWVGFATLVVLKTSAAGTRSSAFQAAVGTAIGFAVSSVLITTFGVDALIYSIMLPVVVFAAFYLPTAVSFIAGQAFFTMVIVVLFNLLKPAGWTVGLVRFEDVLVGAAIGLFIGVAIWPRGASSELSRVVGQLFSFGGRYAQATVSRVLGRAPDSTAPGGSGPVDAGSEEVLTLWRDQMCVAAVDAEDVFSQYLSEPHQSDAPVMAWASLMATAHQLWFGSSVVALVPEATGAATKMPEVCDGLLLSSALLASNYRGIADALAGQDRLEMRAPLTVGGPVDRSLPDATMTLLQLEAWLAELSVEIERTNPALEVLGLGTVTGSAETTPSPASR